MKRMFKRFLFPVLGISSLIWFLIRVIPKPSRAAYPCMRAAAPIASSFVVWVIGLFSSVFFFKRAKRYFTESRYVLYSVSLLAAILFGMGTILHDSRKAHAVSLSVLEGPNQPMGEGKGINPGRVVWIHDPAATDENCKNTTGDYWYQDDNTNQDVVNAMLSGGLQRLTGAAADVDAWNALFRFFNKAHGKGDVGYTAGEKIVIKINLNALSQGQKNINTSPQIAYALLNQLVQVVGVAQADIGIGDPNISMDPALLNKCRPVLPNVKYWGRGSGLTPVPGTKNNVLFASDGGMQDPLPQCYLDAAYMINMPVFKKHHRGGISLCCKNHFGSITPFNSDGAFPWHYSLPCPDGGADNSNGGYGAYRCFVDIMGHKDLGGKTILYLIDGLWSSINWGHPPIKWRMAPFNNDWPSSLFLSQDPVAIESVCFDFLYTEFDQNHPTEGAYDPGDNHGPFPHYKGVDDYLHQAADSKNWPAGLVYDPEKDGTPLPSSMGVHEHWNNTVKKQYARNLGAAEGIELITTDSDSGTDGKSDDGGIARDFALYANYPNPFNPKTQIRYALPAASHVHLAVYDAAGRLIRTLADGDESAGEGKTKTWDGLTDDGLSAPSGVYICRMTARSGNQNFQQSRKMTLNK